MKWLREPQPDKNPSTPNRQPTTILSYPDFVSENYPSQNKTYR
jgi:hypothetical protein